MARVVVILAAALALVLGGCGIKSEEELAQAVLDDFEVEETVPPSSSSSTTTAGDTGSTTSTTGGATSSTTDDDDDDDDDEDIPPGQEPGDLGDDDALDALTDECFEGEMESCDDLYFDSPLGSDYERYGSTCGGRNDETFGGCAVRYGDEGATAELPPGEEPGDLGDDPALDDLTERCFEGDMQACDQLYVQSPLGSEYEQYGATCGGRNEATPAACVATYGTGD